MTTTKDKKNGHGRIKFMPEGMEIQDVITYMDVISPGTRVHIGPKREIEATVVEVAIKAGPQYRVTWWSGNDRKSEWLEPSEVFTDEKKVTIRLGFGVINGDN